MTVAERLFRQPRHPSSVERDPASGMIVDGVNAKHRAEYAGDSYFFCSARCREKFIAEPARYRLSPQGGTGGATG